MAEGSSEGVDREEAVGVDAREVAYLANRGDLLRLATLLAGSVERGEDLVQEAFLRAASHLDALTEAQTKAYLRETMLNVWRSQLRRTRLELRHLSSARSSYVSYMMNDPEIELLRAIGGLSPRQRTCLILRYYEDMKLGEIADALNCSESSVKQHLSRALDRLRKGVADGP